MPSEYVTKLMITGDIIEIMTSYQKFIPTYMQTRVQIQNVPKPAALQLQVVNMDAFLCFFFLFIISPVLLIKKKRMNGWPGGRSLLAKSATR